MCFTKAGIEEVGAVTTQGKKDEVIQECFIMYRNSIVACFGLLMANTVFAIPYHQYAIGPQVSYFHFAGKRSLDDGGAVGVNGTYWLNPSWGVNASVSYLGTSQSKSPHHDVSGQLYSLRGIYHFHQFLSLRPYLAGGVGVWHFSRVTGSQDSTQSNINAGVGVRYFVDPRIAFNLEANDYFTTTGATANDVGVSLGIEFLWDSQHHVDEHENGPDHVSKVTEVDEGLYKAQPVPVGLDE